MKKIKHKKEIIHAIRDSATYSDTDVKKRHDTDISR